MIRIFFFLIFVSLFLTWCTGENISPFFTSPSPIESTGGLYATGLTEDQKVQLAIERKKELRTIRKGDYMTLKNNPEQALAYYSAALEQLPDDVVIRRKIAHAYYLTRNWKDAYNNYSRVPISELKDTEYSELFSSLFFDETRLDRIAELARYDLDIPTREYYQTIDICYSGIHNCIVTIEAYTGSSTRILDLQSTIGKSTQISEDYQYRNFLTAAELYRQWAYRAVDILTNEILTKRPNYTEVKKLRWFALYELGRYTTARDILLAYLESNPKDLESISRLGEIYASLGDYITSSLYINNAIIAWYPHKTELERRLAYNYAALGDHVSMLKVLSYLLQESDVTEDDYAVAISLALREWENTRAYAWSYAGIEKYKNSLILTPLYLSALRLNGKSNDIPRYIDTLESDTAKSPLVQLEYALSLVDTWASEQAIPILLAIRDLDPTTDWGIEADTTLRNIEFMRSQSGTIQQ